MIAAVLGWTKLPQWALELIVIAAVAGGILYWQHHEINKGIALQKAADDKASAPLIQQAKAETAELRVKATMAEQTHAKEMADLQNLTGSHANQPVRLCIDSHAGGQGVRPASTGDQGNRSTGSVTASVQPMPNGNSESGAGRDGPDIEPMLTALGAAADKVSAELRELQSR
jgi:hypothetical protein